jgi:hypothetical protein
MLILPERPYSSLTDDITYPWGNERADILIARRHKSEPITAINLSKHAEAVIEVKRSSASAREIDKDIRRLHQYLKHLPHAVETREFLVLVAQGHVPRPPRKDAPYINPDIGLAQKGPYHHSEGLAYRVRRVLKAATSLSKNSRAHYVLLLEIETPAR